jgi:hypothetical protein
MNNENNKQNYTENNPNDNAIATILAITRDPSSRRNNALSSLTLLKVNKN